MFRAYGPPAPAPDPHPPRQGLQVCESLGLVQLLVPQVGDRQPLDTHVLSWQSSQRTSRPSTGGPSARGRPPHVTRSSRDTSWAWKWQVQESTFVKNNY